MNLKGFSRLGLDIMLLSTFNWGREQRERKAIRPLHLIPPSCAVFKVKCSLTRASVTEFLMVLGTCLPLKIHFKYFFNFLPLYPQSKLLSIFLLKEPAVKFTELQLKLVLSAMFNNWYKYFM